VVAAGLVAAAAGVVLAANGDVGDGGCGGGLEVDVIFFIFFQKRLSCALEEDTQQRK
jgi:hypothetical protein